MNEFGNKVILESRKHGWDAFKNQGIGNHASDQATWSISSGGAGGVIFSTVNQQQAVLKLDGNNTEPNQIVYTQLERLQTSVVEPLPFEIPKMTVAPLLGNDLADMMDKIDSKIDELNQIINNPNASDNDKQAAQTERTEATGWRWEKWDEANPPK